MKIKRIAFSLISLTLLTVSCGHKETENPNLTPLQNQAVTIVKKHLERGDKLIESQVVEEPMPAAVIEQPFQNLRNVVFKAGLDYQSCKTRGLEKGMQMAEEKISDARVQILQTDSLLTSNIGEDNSLIVLAKIKTKKSIDGTPRSLIAVFDPSTMEVKEWIPVTTPVQNTVALVIAAKDNILQEYSQEQNKDTKVFVSKTTDPVLKFVLEANPL